MSMRHLILILVLLTFGAAAIAGAHREDDVRQKARYYYLEGVDFQTQGNNAAAYELYKRAYRLDSTYAEAASAYGSMRLMADGDSLRTKEARQESLELMRTFVDRYPDDQNESRFYAFAAARTGNLPEAVRVYKRTAGRFPKNTDLLVELADVYMASDSIDRAIESLSAFEKVEGSSPQLSLRKISYLLSKNDTVRAMAEARSMLSANPTASPYWILMGNLFDVVSQPDSALKYYKLAEEMSPRSGSAKMALANYYRQQGDSVAYDAKIYEALLCEEYGLEEKTNLLAEYLQTLISEKNDTARGDYLFGVLKEQYPHEPFVLDLSARYNAAKGNYGAAAESISYAIDMEPDNDAFWGQLMTYQIQAERYKDAVVTYERAEAYFAPTEGLDLLRASALSMDSAWNEAIEAFGKLIHRVNVTLPLTDSITDKAVINHLEYEDLARLSTYYQLMGDAYYQRGDLEQSFIAYGNSLLFMPDNAATLNNYAYFLVENGGDLERAYHMSLDAITQEPDNSTYLDTFAWILFKRQEYAEALEHQKKAVEKAEEENNVSAELYEHYGDILFMNSKPDQAVECWEKALKLAPGKELLKRKVTHKTFFYE